MFWQRFYDICSTHGTKPNPVAKEIGISSGILTKWKNSGALPSGETLMKLADYFNCSVDYLLGRTVSPSELSPEALELASRWDKLDDDGKALVRAELVHAERGKQHDQLE